MGSRHILTVAFVAGLVAAAVAAGAARQAARVPAQPKPIKTTPPKEWPSAKAAARQKQEAEARPLFAATTPLVFTLTANLKAVQADRSPTSTKTFPATIEFRANGGAVTTVELPIRTRGNVRRSYDICEFAPLRLEFPKEQMKGTVFEGQHVLKLGVHCRDVKVFEQYVLREYAAYRILNLLTPRSFRARLAKVTYIDSGAKKTLGTKYGILIEDDEDVARRMEGRLVTQTSLFSRLDKDTFTLVTLFEYMIGNLDMSILAQHNFKFVQVPAGAVYPIPYDFDYSGLVDASYALPPPDLHITTVRDRVYRGDCRTPTELETFFVKFRAMKADLAPLYDTIPDFDPAAKKRALAYLDEFYKTIARPADVKAAFTANCLNLSKGLM
jgi:hypothetical protein